MITLKFYTPEERIPFHDQEIVFVDDDPSLGVESFLPTQGTVEYYWEEYDQDGNQTGTTALYDPETEASYSVDDIFVVEDSSDDLYFVLRWKVNGHTPDSIAYWTPLHEFWSSIL